MQISKYKIIIIYLPPIPGQIDPKTFLHLGVRAASSASGSRGGARRPSIATARWRAHSRRRVVSAAGGIWVVDDGAAGYVVVAERCCCCCCCWGEVERVDICWVVGDVVAGAEVILRAMRWASEVGGWEVRCR